MTKLTDIQKDFLIRWFEYRMTADDRRDLMQEMPMAYNAMVGREVATVVNQRAVEPHDDASVMEVKT